MKKQINNLIGKNRVVNESNISAVLINPLPNSKQPLINPYFQNLQPQAIVENVFVRYFCSQCKKSVHRVTFITCKNQVYCIPCFATDEVQQMVGSQNYSVISHLNFPIMEYFWPAEHELLLLNAIQKNGFGNWQGIQEFMKNLGAYYSLDELESHYDKFYGSSHHYQPVIVPQQQAFSEVLIQEKLKVPERRAVKPPFQKQKIKQKNTNIAEQFDPLRQNCNPFTCYNYKRQQFFSSYNQRLEKYIAEIEFRDSDSLEEFQIKMKMLQCYNRGIKDREEKQNMIVEHNLFNKAYTEEKEYQLAHDQFLTHASILVNPLMKYTTFSELQQLLNNVCFCLKIQSMIKALRENKNKFGSLNAINSQRINFERASALKNYELNEGIQPRKRMNLDLSEDTNKEFRREILKIERTNLTDKFNLTENQLKSILNFLEQKGQNNFESQAQFQIQNKLKQMNKMGIIIKKLN